MQSTCIFDGNYHDQAAKLIINEQCKRVYNVPFHVYYIVSLWQLYEFLNIPFSHVGNKIVIDLLWLSNSSLNENSYMKFS